MGGRDVSGTTEPGSGFILVLDDPYLEMSFGDSGGRAHLQVSSDTDVWIGEATLVPEVSASASGSLEADSGGAPLDVAVEVTC
ncbi:MAG: hypothetical protein M5U31_01005 [Acidimicrobiia bacterium]|nr:hypothetical protein [Acidimicrobiia bacterium]